MAFHRKAKRVISLVATAALVISSVFVQDIFVQADEVAGIPYNSSSTGTHGTGITWTYYKAAEENADADSFLILEGNGQGSSTAVIDVEDENYGGFYHYKDQYEKQGWYQDCRTTQMTETLFTNFSGRYENLPEIFISNVHTVSACSFYNQRKIKTVWISDNVKELSEFCFGQTTGLKDIYIYGDLEKVDVSAFYYTGLMAKIHVATDATKTLIENAINSDSTFKSRGTVVKDLSVDDTPLRIAIKKGTITTNTNPDGSGFAKKTWNALTKALTDGQNAFATLAGSSMSDSDKRELVTAKTGDINDALEGLVSSEVLDAAIEAADKLQEADYTADSWKPFKEALATAKSELGTVDSKERVAELASALDTAMKGLKPLTADDAKEELNAVLAKAGKLVESDYSEATWTAFAPALEEAKTAADSNTISTITAATTKLQEAMDALVVEHPFEWVALAGLPTGNKATEVISVEADSEMAGATKAEFVIDCMPTTEFNQFISIAMKYRIDGEPFGTTIKGESKYNNVKGTKDIKVPIELEKPIVEGKPFSVTAATDAWAAVKGDVFRFKAVNFYNESGELVKSITAPGVKGVLDNAIKAAEEKLTALADSADYTAESIAAAQEILTSAKAIEDEEEILPSMVNTLNQVADGSSAILVPSDTTAAKEGLDAVLTEAGACQESNYTAESWQALKTAVEAAENVAEDALVSEIEALKKAVSDAIKALVPVETTTAAPGDTPKPGETAAPGGDTPKPGETAAPGGDTPKPGDTAAPGGAKPGETAAPGGNTDATANPPSMVVKPGKAAIKKVTAKKSKVTVTLKKKVAGATSYQVVAADNKKFKKPAQVTVKAGKKLTLSVKYNKLKIKKGKAFYVKVRAVKKADGENVYGSYSAVKKFTAK